MGFPVEETKSPTIKVESLNWFNARNPNGTRFEFDGGRHIQVVASGTNPPGTGLAGFRGSYRVYMRTYLGGIVPNLPDRDRSILASHLFYNVPVRRNIEAPFDSQYGYHWIVDLWPDVVSANQGDVNFEVFREPV